MSRNEELRHAEKVIAGVTYTVITTGEKGVYPDHSECEWCGTDWPCDARRFLDRAIEAELRLAELRLAADEVIAADALAESGVVGSDRRWDEALQRLAVLSEASDESR